MSEIKAKCSTFVKTRGDKFEVALKYIDELTGKTKVKSFGRYNSKKEAEQQALVVKLKYKNNLIDLKSDTLEGMTLNECIEKGLESNLKRRKHKSVNTNISYERAYRNHVKDDMGQYLVISITRGMIQDFIDRKAESYSKSTITQILSAVKHGIKYALQHEIIQNDITKGLTVWTEKEKTKNNVKFLEVRDLKKLLEDVKGTDFEIPTYIGAYTGARIGEVLALKWEDVDFDKNLIHIRNTLVKNEKGDTVLQEFTKGKENRDVQIPTNLKKKLKEWKLQSGNKDRYIVVREDKEEWDLTNFSNRFSLFAKKMNFPISFHTLRHTYVSILISQDIPITTISLALGHKNLSTTVETYAHLLKDKKENIAKAMDNVI